MNRVKQKTLLLPHTLNMLAIPCQDAAHAIDNMNDSELFGRTIRVNLAKPMKVKEGASRAGVYTSFRFTFPSYLPPIPTHCPDQDAVTDMLIVQKKNRNRFENLR